MFEPKVEQNNEEPEIAGLVDEPINTYLHMPKVTKAIVAIQDGRSLTCLKIHYDIFLFSSID
jgi:hypothetical protein